MLSSMQKAMKSKSLLNENVENSNKIQVVIKAKNYKPE